MEKSARVLTCVHVINNSAVAERFFVVRGGWRTGAKRLPSGIDDRDVEMRCALGGSDSFILVPVPKWSLDAR